ncbi:MAG: hypothetical protein O3A47_13010 [Chloroflexi bacterium]|nr:hypothetical protein [Chloroflexota bacterium]
MNRTAVSNDPRELMAEHLDVLRDYAKRVVVSSDVLAVSEEEDKNQRMGEYLAIGESFDLTYSEMVGQIFKGLHKAQKGCGCPTCRSRASRLEQP